MARGPIKDLINKILKRKVIRYPEDETTPTIERRGGTRKEIITPRKGIVKTTSGRNKAKTKIKGKNITKKDLLKAEIAGSTGGRSISGFIKGSKYPITYRGVRKSKDEKEVSTTKIKKNTPAGVGIVKTKNKKIIKGMPNIRKKRKTTLENIYWDQIR